MVIAHKGDLRKKAAELFAHMGYGRAECVLVCKRLGLPPVIDDRTEHHYQELVNHLEALRANEDCEVGEWVLGIWIPLKRKG
jgi:hypothetical protein